MREAMLAASFFDVGAAAVLQGRSAAVETWLRSGICTVSCQADCARGSPSMPFEHKRPGPGPPRTSPSPPSPSPPLCLGPLVPRPALAALAVGKTPDQEPYGQAKIHRTQLQLWSPVQFGTQKPRSCRQSNKTLGSSRFVTRQPRHVSLLL